MSESAIDKILGRANAHAPEPVVQEDTTKFYSLLIGEGNQEHFLEFRFRSGGISCFSYSDLQWFHYDPEEGCIDMEFGGIMVVIRGRGLSGRLFQGIRQKRLTWLKESDSDMEDHKDNDAFVSSITITAPQSLTNEETSDAA